MQETKLTAKLTAKQRVQTCFPAAVCVKDDTGRSMILAGPEGEPGPNPMQLGSGSNPNAAWNNAAQALEVKTEEIAQVTRQTDAELEGARVVPEVTRDQQTAHTITGLQLPVNDAAFVVKTWLSGPQRMREQILAMEKKRADAIDFTNFKNVEAGDLAPRDFRRLRMKYRAMKRAEA